MNKYVNLYLNTHTGELKSAKSKRVAIKLFKEDAKMCDYYFEKKHIEKTSYVCVEVGIQA